MRYRVSTVWGAEDGATSRRASHNIIHNAGNLELSFGALIGFPTAIGKRRPKLVSRPMTASRSSIGKRAAVSMT